jgi:NagD protein
MTAALHERKIASDSIKPDFVVVGEGPATTYDLAKAHTFVEQGARLVVTNPDNWCPISPENTRPGAGATSAFLEASTGRRAYYLGKPNAYMFQRARRRLTQAFRQQLEQTIMIGDTMATDIRGAIEVGMLAYLVLSGSTQLEEVGDYVYQPTRILNSVADLVDEIKLGHSKDGGNILPNGPHPRSRVGNRHQTDVYSLMRPRPRAPMTK